MAAIVALIAILISIIITLHSFETVSQSMALAGLKLKMKLD